jgi:hypothetical protein
MKDTNTAIQPKHDHPHDETKKYSHASEISPKIDKPDWLNDNLPNSTPSKKDPWKQIEPTNKTTADDETYPPRNWDKTEDPKLYATYYYAQLLKQFGDIPEVHIIGEHRLNKAKGVPTTLGKFETYLEAMYSLFPI